MATTTIRPTIDTRRTASAPGRPIDLANATQAILRIGTGLLFFQHGAPKLFGWFGGFGEPGVTAPLFSLFGLAGVLEVFGGILIAIGFLTRPVAIVLALEMIIAFVKAHLPNGWVPIMNQGELALLYMVVFVFLVGNGAGPASVDRWLASRRRGL